jgi:predicted PurR-regulated permease PerM
MGQMAGFFGPRRFQPRGIRAEIATARSLSILATLAIIAALYFGKAIFLPLAVAILLTFVLAPPVRVLRAWGLGRIPSVALVVVLAFLVIFGIGSFVAQQAVQLAEKLPQYQFTIQQKVHALSVAASGGALERLSTFLEHLNEEIGKNNPASTQTAPGSKSSPPIPVEIHQPTSTPVQVIQRVLEPLWEPLASFGLVLIFVIFFLLERRDLRDRLIRLAGSHDLQRTTDAINDGARRLSRYFLAQTALNAFFGIVVAVGLAFIGLPNPVLWGILAMLSRFVPYIGAFMAAAFPTALAIAVDPGWSMALWTVGLFVVVESLIGQVIEPMVYGHSTGISPVAVIISATFWTWLWGPVGLLLSTPLMVCLGVLGRHIEWLQFLDVLIGDEAPLTPAQSFYQRVLAGDSDEAIDQADEVLKRSSLVRYYDDVVLPGLLLAQVDYTRGALDEKHVVRINRAVRELIEQLSANGNKIAKAAVGESRKTASVEPDQQQQDSSVLSPARTGGGQSVLCIAGRGPLDDLTAEVLSQLLRLQGIQVRLEADSAASSSNIVRLSGEGVIIVCLSSLHLGQSSAHLRHSIRRLQGQIPDAKILVGLWGSEGDLAKLLRSADYDFNATSLEQAIEYCIAAVRSSGAKTGIEKEAVETGTAAA